MTRAQINRVLDIAVRFHLADLRSVDAASKAYLASAAGKAFAVEVRDQMRRSGVPFWARVFNEAGWRPPRGGGE